MTPERVSFYKQFGDILTFMAHGHIGSVLNEDRSCYDLSELKELPVVWRDRIILAHLAARRHTDIGFFMGIDWVSEEWRKEAFYWVVGVFFAEAENDRHRHNKPPHWTWIEEALEVAWKRGWEVPENWAEQTEYRYDKLVREHLFSKPWDTDKYTHYTQIRLLDDELRSH